MNFKLWLELNYLDVGHKHKNDDPYIFWRGQLYLASESGYRSNKEDFHGDVKKSIWGRIDHDAKVISMSAYFNKDNIDDAKLELKERFPDYKIYFFKTGSYEQIG